MKRYVLTRHVQGLMSLVYIADMETGEVTESLISIQRTGRTCIVTTSERERLLTRICYPKINYRHFGRTDFEYRVPSHFLEISL